jgi:hypothetical protein
MAARTQLRGTEALGPCPTSPLLLDCVDELHDVLYEAQLRFPLLKRTDGALARLWGRRLAQPTTNLVWAKQARDHARLLLQQIVDKGELSLPFTRQPPEAGLNNLQPWWVAGRGPDLLQSMRRCSARRCPSCRQAPGVPATEPWLWRGHTPQHGCTPCQQRNTAAASSGS